MSAPPGGRAAPRRPAEPPREPPAELPVALTPGVRVLSQGRVLLGHGSPARLMLLTEAGARAVDGWRRCAPVGAGAPRGRLARRLLDAGILTPHPRPAASTAQLTVVVPVRDRPAQLTRCLDAIRAACPESPVIVVDDGSIAAEAVAEVCAAGGVRVIQRRGCGGPAAARNDGLAVCTTPFVAFVDSDVVLGAGVAHRLLGHLADPALGAVAPRVRALEPSAGIIGGYERRHSALDMGATGGLVAPGTARAYVPSTVLFVRRDAVGAGFDPSLRAGEDVDLVWRLCAAGWRVRYAAEVDVHHEHRAGLRAFVGVRRRYARSVGTLARRHPAALPAMWVSPAVAVPWALTLAGRPRAALMAAGWATARRGERLRRFPGRPYGLAAATMARGLTGTGSALARAARRPWAPPLLLLAARDRRVAWALAVAFAAPLVQDALATRDPRAVAGDVPLRLLEELVAASATWEGCLRARTVRPLLPSWRPVGAVAA
ncbi:MAG TPA: mycofactocin biosynthesis glycosyltransferase MftF [Solirubrobacteraceae bacterium]|nr:mycofactocin biosynthesis glycosyltransferase MftF [Solirubrobacteraceae bacterium]